MNAPARFSITAESPDRPEAQALIARHLGQMGAQSPEDSCHAMGAEGLSAPGVAFFLIWRDGQAIGMGALKPISGGAMELKSMHTLAEMRGTGAGRAMLEHLLGVARQEGARAIYLETGSTDDFLPARRLYAAYGFVEVAPFEEYEPDPWSTFMALELEAGAGE